VAAEESDYRLQTTALKFRLHIGVERQLPLREGFEAASQLVKARRYSVYCNRAQIPQLLVLLRGSRQSMEVNAYEFTMGDVHEIVEVIRFN
jgi:hypothetical protein